MDNAPDCSSCDPAKPGHHHGSAPMHAPKSCAAISSRTKYLPARRNRAIFHDNWQNEIRNHSMNRIGKTYWVTASPQLLCNCVSTYLQIFRNSPSNGSEGKADAFCYRDEWRSALAQLAKEHTGQAQFPRRSACPQAARQRATGGAWRMRPLLDSCAKYILRRPAARLWPSRYGRQFAARINVCQARSRTFGSRSQCRTGPIAIKASGSTTPSSGSILALGSRYLRVPAHAPMVLQ